MEAIVYGDTSALDAPTLAALEARKAGASFDEAAAPLGIKGTGLANRLARAGIKVRFRAVCALPECSEVFETADPRKRFCINLHSKRGCERGRLGLDTRHMPCRLPECDETVLCVDVRAAREGRGSARKFCCREHGLKFDSRRGTSFYDKLVERTACEGCGWWGPGLERHHIKPQAEGGSDHPSNLAWMCQNCHCLIHAGLATFTHRRVFTDLREDIRAREVERRHTWGEAH